MNEKKQVSAGIILTYATLAINTIVQLIYTPVVIRLLGKSEYGLYTLVGSVVNYLSLCSFGMTGAYLKFYTKYLKEDDTEKMASLNGIFLILNLFAAVLAICLGIVMVINCEWVLGSGITSGELNRARGLMIILVFNIVCTFPNSVFDSILISRECFFIQRGIRLVSAIMNLFLGLPLLLVGYGSVALVCVTTFLTLCNLFVNALYCLKYLQIKISLKNMDFSLIKQIGGFSFFIFLNMIIDQVNWSVDKMLLGRYWGTATVAVYGVASQINSIYMQCSSAVSSVFAPKVNRYYAENTEESTKLANELFVFVGKIQFVILMLILSGFIFFGRYFIGLWAGEGYDEAYKVTLLLIIPVTIPLVQSLGIEMQRAQNKHHVRSIVYFIVMLLNLLISIFLSRDYGAIGAAAGTAVSMLLGNVFFMNYYYQKFLHIDVITLGKEILYMVPALIIPGGFGSYVLIFQKINSPTEFCIGLVCYCVLYLISMWFLGVKENERMEIIKRINQKRKRE